MREKKRPGPFGLSLLSRCSGHSQQSWQKSKKKRSKDEKKRV